MRKIKLFFVAVALLVTSLAYGQNITVTGKVIDSSTGEPLPGAAILVKGTADGVVADFDGNYSISVPKDATLGFTTIGFEDAEIAVNGRTVINVSLRPSFELIEDAVVVAFGTKRKQDLVGSVSSVKQELLKNTMQASVSNALEGAVAGLQIVSSTGQPGSDAGIMVRGIGSLSAGNGALIVVDGTPFNGKLSDINPQDIESITVSKDAVSNSLYGSRASGGVVMVTTKTGAKEKAVIRFNANAGVVSRAYKDYDMVTDPGEFYELVWYGIRNSQWAAGSTLEEAAQFASANLLSELAYNSFNIPAGEYLVGLDGKLNPNATQRYYDPFSDAMFHNAVRQQYDLSASGNNGRSDYYISVGYLDNDSYIIGSNYNRLTARANVNSQLKDWLKVGMNIGIGKTNSNGVQESSSAASNPFQVARDWAPIYPVHAYDAQGKVKLDANGNPIYDAGTGQTDGITKPRPTATNQNVICNLNEDIRSSIRHNISTRAYAQFDFLKHFSFKTSASYDYTASQSVTYYTPTIGDGQSFGGRGTHEAGFSNTLNTDEILSYENLIGSNHSISAKIGHEYYKYSYKYLGGQKTNFFDPTNPELDNGGPMQELSSYTLDHNIEGFFGMVDYNYASKYYVSGSFRRDGTSRFLNKWGNFWSVAAAWRLSAEGFMAGTKNWLDELKIRASYGTQGNESLGSNYTPYQDLYSVTWDGSALGYSYAAYGNPNLSWEKQNTFDVGIDFGFLGRIHGTADYFKRYTYDMIFDRPLPESSGRPYNTENIGNMENYGFEFELGVDIIKNQDFFWNVSLVGSSYKNTILTLPEENREDGIVSGSFKLFEGKSRYEYFTYKYAGMDEVGNALWYKDVLDKNGDPTGEIETTSKYSDATKYWLGKSAIPDFTGGLNTTLQYKGFDLSIATAFQIGGYGYDSEYTSSLSTSYYVGHNRAMWDTFNPETGSGKYPLWNTGNTSNTYTQTSDAHLVTASYFNLKNVTLGYSLPAKVINKLGIQGIRIYATGENLFLKSARQGYDPRISINGGNSGFGGYSPYKVISGGIQFTF